MTNENKPELGGIFVFLGAIAGLMTGIDAATTGEDAFWGGVAGLAIGAFIGRIVERVVFRMILLGFALLRIYLSLKSWGLIE